MREQPECLWSLSEQSLNIATPISFDPEGKVESVDWVQASLHLQQIKIDTHTRTHTHWLACTWNITSTCTVRLYMPEPLVPLSLFSQYNNFQFRWLLTDRACLEREPLQYLKEKEKKKEELVDGSNHHPREKIFSNVCKSQPGFMVHLSYGPP